MTRQATMKIIIGLAFVVLVVPLGAVYAGEHPVVFDLTVSDSTNITEYINRLYISAVAIAGITAVVMIVIGSIYYVVSGGSQDKQREGKDIITSAIWGVVLLLGAYTILNTVNPELVTLKPPAGDKVTKYSCAVLKETTPDISECGAGERPIENPSDPNAIPQCCIPGLGSGLTTICPQEIKTACQTNVVSEGQLISVPNCGDTCEDNWGLWDTWEEIEIQTGGRYLQWTYYPKKRSAAASSTIVMPNPNNISAYPYKEYYAQCVPYAYKIEEGDEWETDGVNLDGLSKC